MSSQVHVQDWMESHGPEGILEFDAFFRGVAEARFVVRRVTRIVDEQARNFSLDPLEHQLLIQLFGAKGHNLSVNRLAERIDVPAAVASRLVKALESEGFVRRHKSEIDRRVTDVHLSASGRRVCIEIWEKVRTEMEMFQEELSEEARQMALIVFGFYVGVALDFTG